MSKMVALVAAVFLAACGPDSNGLGEVDGGAVTMPGAGGAGGTSATSSSGGATGTGGRAASSGGATATGGHVASSTGGAQGTGGAAAVNYPECTPASRAVSGSCQQYVSAATTLTAMKDGLICVTCSAAGASVPTSGCFVSGAGSATSYLCVASCGECTLTCVPAGSPAPNTCPTH